MCANRSVPIELHPVGGKNFLISLKRFGQRGHKFRVESHVVVHKEQQIARSNRGAPVQCRREAKIFSKKQPAGSMLTRHFGGVIRRTIINNDDFQPLQRLRYKTRQANAKMLRSIPIDNDHGDSGFLSQDSSHCPYEIPVLCRLTNISPEPGPSNFGALGKTPVAMRVTKDRGLPEKDWMLLAISWPFNGRVDACRVDDTGRVSRPGQIHRRAGVCLSSHKNEFTPFQLRKNILNLDRTEVLEDFSVSITALLGADFDVESFPLHQTS